MLSLKPPHLPIPLVPFLSSAFVYAGFIFRRFQHMVEKATVLNSRCLWFLFLMIPGKRKQFSSFLCFGCPSLDQSLPRGLSASIGYAIAMCSPLSIERQDFLVNYPFRIIWGENDTSTGVQLDKSVRNVSIKDSNQGSQDRYSMLSNLCVCVHPCMCA